MGSPNLDLCAFANTNIYGECAWFSDVTLVPYLAQWHPDYHKRFLRDPKRKRQPLDL